MKNAGLGLVLYSKPGERHYNSTQLKTTQGQFPQPAVTLYLLETSLVLQNFVSLNSPSLFCFRNVLVKTNTCRPSLGTPASYWKKPSHDLGIRSI